ncbi:MAG: hypothetical protein KDD99_15030 [Bacteroidetes bacterium]|nr:hypothetical protein [Bacteroidota bacterium]
MKIQKTLFLILTIAFFGGIMLLESCKQDKTNDTENPDKTKIEEGDTIPRNEPLDQPAIACLVLYKNPTDPFTKNDVQIAFDESLEATVDSIGFSKFRSNCTPAEPGIKSTTTSPFVYQQACGIVYGGDLTITFDPGAGDLVAGGCYLVDVVVITSSPDHTYTYTNETMYVQDLPTEPGPFCPNCTGN